MYKYIKRAMDFLVAVILLTVLSPLMLLAAVLIAVNRDGPILFKQKRPGKDGKIFTVYKFRTMSTALVDKKGKELSDFERMTKIGKILRKTSIDELPQLFNIIKGDMSFIGPRPLLTEYLDLYSPEQMRRHEVLPGISGWAQVNGRNTLTWEQKFAYDIYYVDHYSFSMDMKIFFKTIENVLRQDGINSGNDNTMKKFTGNTEKV
ncbi:MAG TPA: lipid carrier--UDP-N-acetylgalactosaminyltransferase [Ruminococcaceae bacterium]|nr:lipid carrier--UDP-N-acetylgalactosaminyltransferase [Oscillospiraceae bacterium]HCT16626.1 lipid carrier--UDP-N-acetylgalactosaminyltransferase [Oscillospiraceae bacterium]